MEQIDGERGVGGGGGGEVGSLRKRREVLRVQLGEARWIKENIEKRSKKVGNVNRSGKTGVKPSISVYQLHQHSLLVATEVDKMVK